MLKRFRKSQSGTAMVEFAIIAPFLIFLVIGLIEVGRYMYFCVLATHAAEAGAQYGSQSLANYTDIDGMKSAASADAGGVTWTVNATHYCSLNGVQTLCGSILAGGGSSSASTGTTYYVKVKVKGTFSSLLSYPGIPNQITVSQTSVMRVLNQ